MTFDHTFDMTEEVKSEFDVDIDIVNISARTSPITSNIAVIVAADEPRCEKSWVTVVKAGTRQSLRLPSDAYKPQNMTG